MSDASQTGVLYTEHAGLAARIAGGASLWSYETRPFERGRPSVLRRSDGTQEYWLERSDPLLNTILPGTGVSLVVNLGDLWTAGRSLATSSFLPRVCVAGPVTQSRILCVGRIVRTVGAAFPCTMTSAVFGVPAAELVDRIVPLEDLWSASDAARLLELVSGTDVRRAASILREELVARTDPPDRFETVGQTAPGLIRGYAGQVSIDRMAKEYGLNRQQFARRFTAAAGLPPKVFARITRFQALVHSLLSTDVSQWAPLASESGFYDQAHMINEFREFAGASPTAFFQPRDAARVSLRGRPSEWPVT